MVEYRTMKNSQKTIEEIRKIKEIINPGPKNPSPDDFSEFDQFFDAMQEYSIKTLMHELSRGELKKKYEEKILSNFYKAQYHSILCKYFNDHTELIKFIKNPYNLNTETNRAVVAKFFLQTCIAENAKRKNSGELWQISKLKDKRYLSNVQHETKKRYLSIQDKRLKILNEKHDLSSIDASANYKDKEIIFLCKFLEEQGGAQTNQINSQKYIAEKLNHIHKDNYILVFLIDGGWKSYPELKKINNEFPNTIWTNLEMLEKDLEIFKE